MIYSIVVWGFDTDNDYQHDCDLIKAKIFLKLLITLSMLDGRAGHLQELK